MLNRKTWTFRELLEEGERHLKEASIIEAKVDARLLLTFVTGMNLTNYFLHEKEIVEEMTATRFLFLIEERKKRKPLSYIIKSRGFMGMDFFVDETVLIPEQDTETMVEEVLKVSRDKKVLDLCTGSGCIAISLVELGEVKEVVASDISKEALEVAKTNMCLLSAENKEKMRLIEGDLFQNINEKFDIIVSNPPYIESKVIDGLQPEVSVYEPRLALDGSEDGLLFYRRIAEEAKDYFEENGILFLEIGSGQAEAVKKILQEERFHNIRVLKDLAHLDRVVVAEF